MRRIVFAALVMLPTATLAAEPGANFTGAVLKRNCEAAQAGKDETLYSAGVCLGVLRGAALALMALKDLGKDSGLCMEGFSGAQLERVYLDFAKAHPEHMSLPDGYAATLALRAAYPCPR